MLQAFITSCIKANQEIYEYMTTHISSTDLEYSNSTGEGGDNSLNIDLIFENIFIKHLCDMGDIYTEEAGFIKGNGQCKIIIDPLDGSANFLAGLPYYGTSVALQINEVTKASCVCNLANHTLIYKIENEKAIQLDLLSLIHMHFFERKSVKMGIFEKAYAYPNITQKLFEANIKFRSPGAVALSLAYAFNYDFVLFAGKIRAFDIEAALHICKELNVYKNNEFLIVSKNNQVFNKIKEIIKE